MSEKKEEDFVKFRMLDWKIKSPDDTVVFELEDGTIVRHKVDINRAGVAINFKNPDGTPFYQVEMGGKITIIPASKEFQIPKSQLPPPPPKPYKEHPTVV